MPFDFKRSVDRGRAILAEFTAGQKTITALALIGLIVGAYLFSSWASKPSYTPLFSNLAASDASSITDKLNAQKEPYQLADGGATILVPQKDVYQLRLNMAKANLPTGGVSGFSLLDKGGVTTSQFQQNVEYQQAIEGELVKTIEAIDGVNAAVVNVVMPNNDIFSADTTKPTASVLVTTDPTKPLGPEQVQAIVHLVSSSVEGLNPNDVTVADSQGNVLSAPGSDGSISSAQSLQDEQTSAYEQRLSGAVQQMLQPVVGAGHVIVQVNAALNFDSTQTTSETYPRPTAGASPLPQSQSTSSEVYTTSPTAASGILGPNNVTAPSPSPSASPGTYVSQSSTTDFLNDRVVQTVNTAPGAVQHLGVAVLLDSNAAKSVNVSEIKSLVSSAAGVEASRGDTVQVSTMPFDQSAAKAAQRQLAAAAKTKSMSKLMNYGKDGVLGVILLAAVVLFMRRAKKSQERTPLLSTSERLELEEARRLLAIAAAPEPADHRELSPSPRMSEKIELFKPIVDEEIGDLVERQPEEVAQLLRGWLADRRGS